MPTGQAQGTPARGGDQRPAGERADKGPGSVAGNMTHDPELRFTQSGRAVCSISVAYADRIKDDATGKYKDGPTVYYEIQAWGNLAENICQALQRGDRVVAEGRWEEQQWVNKDGEDKTRVVLVARDLGPSGMFREFRVIRPERKAS